MKLRTVLCILGVLILVAGINLLILFDHANQELRYFEEYLAYNNINPISLTLENKTLSVTVSTEKDAAADGGETLKARHILSLIRAAEKLPQNLVVEIVNNAGIILSRNTFEHVGRIASDGYGQIRMEESMFTYRFQYDCQQRGINCKKMAISSCIGLEGRALRIELTTTLQTLQWTLTSAREVIETLNADGAGICRYNIFLYHENGTLLYLDSHDLVYDDSLIYRSQYITFDVQ